MKRMLAVLALSALTLIGGHFFNRRWDRAVLLFVSLVLWGAGVYLSLMRRLPDAMVADGKAGMSAAISVHWKVFGVGVLALWIVGLIVTYWDARRANEALSHRWTASGRVGAIVLSALTSLFLLTLAYSFRPVNTWTDVASDRADRESARADHRNREFSHYVYLGHYAHSGRDLPPPPSGGGNLHGRFLYEDKPASGVSLRLVLNGKYETTEVTTDENGVFTVRLPSGEWTVHRLVTQEWEGRPDEGDFMVLAGTEPKLVGDRLSERGWLEGEGRKIAVTEEPAEPQLNFTIRKRVVLTWPTASKRRAPATLANGVIAWEPYPDAENYVVRITEVKREGRTTSYFRVATRTVNGATEFPLATLTAIPGEEEKEYQVSVMAFSKDGSFLSESSAKFADLTFVLVDRQQLVREDERAFASESWTTEDFQQIRENNRRIEAIEVLLKDGLFDEAEKVLPKIEGRVDPGRKAAVTGYLMAKRGRCAEANRLFGQALTEGGKSCVPDYYRAGCGK